LVVLIAAIVMASILLLGVTIRDLFDKTESALFPPANGASQDNQGNDSGNQGNGGGNQGNGGGNGSGNQGNGGGNGRGNESKH